jgi:hypothetical protein
MVEEIRGYLMERWYKNRESIAKYEGSILPKIKRRLLWSLHTLIYGFQDNLLYTFSTAIC